MPDQDLDALARKHGATISIDDLAAKHGGTVDDDESDLPPRLPEPDPTFASRLGQNVERAAEGAKNLLLHPVDTPVAMVKGLRDAISEGTGVKPGEWLPSQTPHPLKAVARVVGINPEETYEDLQAGRLGAVVGDIAVPAATVFGPKVVRVASPAVKAGVEAAANIPAVRSVAGAVSKPVRLAAKHSFPIYMSGAHRMGEGNVAAGAGLMSLPPVLQMVGDSMRNFAEAPQIRAMNQEFLDQQNLYPTIEEQLVHAKGTLGFATETDAPPAYIGVVKDRIRLLDQAKAAGKTTLAREKAHEQANKMRAAEEVAAAKAQQAVNDERAAADAVASAREGLEPADTTVTETHKAGPYTARTVYRAAPEDAVEESSSYTSQEQELLRRATEVRPPRVGAIRVGGGRVTPAQARAADPAGETFIRRTPAPSNEIDLTLSSGDATGAPVTVKPHIPEGTVRVAKIPSEQLKTTSKVPMRAGEAYSIDDIDFLRKKGYVPSWVTRSDQVKTLSPSAAKDLLLDRKLRNTTYHDLGLTVRDAREGDQE